MKLPEGWPTEEMVEAIEKIEPNHHSRGAYLRDILITAIDAAPTPLAQECKCDMRTKLVGDGCEVCNPELAAELVAQEDEPVAEIRLDQGEAIIDLTKILEQSVGTKFYTRPADDKLRKAAEEVVHLIGLWISANEIILTIPEAAKVRNLHAALEGK